MSEDITVSKINEIKTAFANKLSDSSGSIDDSELASIWEELDSDGSGSINLSYDEFEALSDMFVSAFGLSESSSTSSESSTTSLSSSSKKSTSSDSSTKTTVSDKISSSEESNSTSKATQSAYEDLEDEEDRYSKAWSNLAESVKNSTEDSSELQTLKDKAQVKNDSYSENLAKAVEENSDLEQLSTTRSSLESDLAYKESSAEYINKNISSKTDLINDLTEDLNNVEYPDKESYKTVDENGVVSYPGYNEAAAKADKEKQAIKEQIIEAKKEIDDYKDKLDDINDDIDSIKSDLTTANSDIAEVLESMDSENAKNALSDLQAYNKLLLQAEEAEKEESEENQTDISNASDKVLVVEDSLNDKISENRSDILFERYAPTSEFNNKDVDNTAAEELYTELKDKDYKALSEKEQTQYLEDLNIDLEKEGYEVSYSEVDGEKEYFFVRENDDGSKDYLKIIQGSDSDDQPKLVHTLIEDGESTGTTSIYDYNELKEYSDDLVQTTEAEENSSSSSSTSSSSSSTTVSKTSATEKDEKVDETDDTDETKESDSEELTEEKEQAENYYNTIATYLGNILNNSSASESDLKLALSLADLDNWESYYEQGFISKSQYNQMQNLNSMLTEKMNDG